MRISEKEWHFVLRGLSKVPLIANAAPKKVIVFAYGVIQHSKQNLDPSAFFQFHMIDMCNFSIEADTLTWYKKQKRVCKFFISLSFFSPRAIFLQTLHIFKIIFRKRFITFHCNWIWQNKDTHIFSALDPETEEQIKLVKDKIRLELV